MSESQKKLTLCKSFFMSNSIEFDYNSSLASYHVAIAIIIFALSNLNYNSLRSHYNVACVLEKEVLQYTYE